MEKKEKEKEKFNNETKSKIESIKLREYNERKWREFNNLRFKREIIKDDILFTIGTNFITEEELIRSKQAHSDYWLIKIKERFFDLIYLATINQLQIVKDPRIEVEQKELKRKEKLEKKNKFKKIKEELNYNLLNNRRLLK